MLTRQKRRGKKKEDTEKEKVRVSSPRKASESGPRGSVSQLLDLQRKIGNRAFGQMIEESAPQRQAGNESTAGTAKGEVPSVVHEVLQTPGQALDAATRASMEQRFGRDFGKVRVHTDQKAAQSAQAVDAVAYTVGQHIVFEGGQYRPEEPQGRKLLARELAHVAQQDSESVPGASALRIGDPWDASEREADRAAAAASSQSKLSASERGASALVQRQVAEALTAAGSAIFAFEAAGGAEAEAATGPPGWLVGLGVVAVGGLLLGAGYLLSRGGGKPTWSSEVTQAADLLRQIGTALTETVLMTKIAEIRKAVLIVSAAVEEAIKKGPSSKCQEEIAKFRQAKKDLVDALANAQQSGVFLVTRRFELFKVATNVLLACLGIDLIF